MRYDRRCKVLLRIGHRHALVALLLKQLRQEMHRSLGKYAFVLRHQLCVRVLLQHRPNRSRTDAQCVQRLRKQKRRRSDVGGEDGACCRFQLWPRERECSKQGGACGNDTLEAVRTGQSAAKCVLLLLGKLATLVPGDALESETAP